MRWPFILTRTHEAIVEACKDSGRREIVALRASCERQRAIQTLAHGQAVDRILGRIAAERRESAMRDLEHEQLRQQLTTQPFGLTARPMGAPR
jgi:uncharacterized protein YbgA (DUF1722 family)